MYKDLILDYIKKFGNSGSIGLFHPMCKIFKSKFIDGIIGYRLELNYAIVISDPLCKENNKIKIAKEFHNFCKNLNKKIIYILISKDFADQLLCSLSGSAFEFGHDIIIDNNIDIRNLLGRYPRLLRQKYKYSIAKKLTVQEYLSDDVQIEKTLIDIAKEWLENRKGPQLYLLPLDIFSYRENKRWFYVKKENQIIGFLMLNKIGSGWILNGSAILKSNAESSASEFLIMQTLEKLRQEDNKSLFIGHTVSSKPGNFINLNFFSIIFIKTIMFLARKIFNLEHRKKYWKKFYAIKKPSYIFFNSSFITLRDFKAILKTFNLSF